MHRRPEPRKTPSQSSRNGTQRVHTAAREDEITQPKTPPERGFPAVGETGFEPATARPPAGCATRLRHSPWWRRFYAGGQERAGDGSRTRSESLEGSSATVNTSPARRAMVAGVQGSGTRPSWSGTQRAFSRTRRSSVGTWPSRTRSDGGHGPVQLSSAPSSVMTDPEKARPSGEASRATSHPYSSTSPRR